MYIAGRLSEQQLDKDWLELAGPAASELTL
jgi:hypothetical protein